MPLASATRFGCGGWNGRSGGFAIFVQSVATCAVGGAGASSAAASAQAEGRAGAHSPSSCFWPARRPAACDSIIPTVRLASG